MQKMTTKKYSCPACRREVNKGNKAFPFCCEKCRGSDLYSWLSEEYKITREIREEDLEFFGRVNPYDPLEF